MEKEKTILLIIHWFIIINFILQILNGVYQVSFVYTIEGHTWPLLGTSSELDYETMMIRRAYAIETWIAITGLSIYLAITEIYPRMKKLGYFD
ncbi:MAG: hypothetical protein ACTSR8_06490 [Promethearchaeota archaeon]